MGCEDRPTLDSLIPAEEVNAGLPNGFEDIVAETSLIVRLALVNGYEQSEGIPYADCLRRAGLRDFICPQCNRLHWEIDCLEPNRIRPLSERRLYLNNYENWGDLIWCWEDMDSKEASQEFRSEEAALQAMENNSLEWSHAPD